MSIRINCFTLIILFICLCVQHSLSSVILSEDGDVIDCIDIHKQPAFDHPALKNHKIQMAPSYNPNIVEKRETKTHDEERKNVYIATQLWRKSGSCPDGTIPIRKTTTNHHKQSNNTDDHELYRKKSSFYNHANTQSDHGKKSNLLLANHSVAMLLAEGFAYLGAKGDIMVWNPNVELDDEYSTSHIALKNGPHDNYENIEAGWMVNPRVYGDRQTRLFVYWTVDASRATGCFDLKCPGFVQTNKDIALGASLYPLSSIYGLPSQITIFIHKDPYTRNWWVRYQNVDIGYWPGELFTLLKGHAVTVQWGGEVYSQNIGNGRGTTTPHTSTGMGNGHYPDFYWWNSGSVTKMRVLQNGGLVKPFWVVAYSDEYNCYQTYLVKEFVPELEFLYGGPGRDDRCP